MPKTTTFDIPLPQPTLRQHELFQVNGSSVQRWVEALPKANLGETARQLYTALSQLNQVVCRPADRLAAMEQLRPVVHTAENGMQRFYLDKPIVLPENARRVADLADFLNRHLADGYALVAAQLAEAAEQRHRAQPMATALHRALTERGRMLLRRYQLYGDPAADFWHVLHQLYYGALLHHVTDHEIFDTLYGDCTVQQSYLRALMLATAQPHQLTQKDQEKVFRQLPMWTRQLTLRTSDLGECTFVFHPTEGRAPGYRQFRDSTKGMLGIDTRRLCEHLTGIMKHASDQAQTLVDRSDLSLQLLTHLHHAWHEVSDRADQRTERQGNIRVTLGLMSTHFFVAGRQPFETFSGEPEGRGRTGSNPFTRPAKDVWAESAAWDTFDKEEKEPFARSAVEAVDYTRTEQKSRKTENSSKYRRYEVGLVNSSPRGYCIRWPSNALATIKTGEVIGLQEDESRHWSAGTVRWIRKVEDGFSHVGVEVLGATAEPFCARMLQGGLATGTGYRALVVPSDSERSSRILLPRAAFKAGQSLELRQPGQQRRLQLTLRTATTRLLAIFEFKWLGTETKFEKEQQKTVEDSIQFDSLWKQL